MTTHFDIAALGEAMVEFNQTHPGEPNYLQGFGGDTSNAVIAAARAGARTTYHTRLGADRFGDELMRLWRHEGVDTSGIERDPDAPTGIYFVTHGPNGHEFTYRRAGSAASRMTPQWLPHAVLEASKILHVSGISLAISPSARETVFEAIRLARRAGRLVSLDSNLRLKLWKLDEARETIARAAALCDIFLPSLEDAFALSGRDEPDEVVEWAHAIGAKQVALKLGDEGALVSDGMERHRIPGRKVKLADATGAGDCFCGNLLARIAIAPLPYAQDVEALL